jgi:hypothetical protein
MFQEKTLQMHTKFIVHIDENDEVSCWVLTYYYPYQDTLTKGIGEKVVEFLGSHSHDLPY